MSVPRDRMSVSTKPAPPDQLHRSHNALLIVTKEPSAHAGPRTVSLVQRPSPPFRYPWYATGPVPFGLGTALGPHEDPVPAFSVLAKGSRRHDPNPTMARTLGGSRRGNSSRGHHASAPPGRTQLPDAGAHINVYAARLSCEGPAVGSPRGPENCISQVRSELAVAAVSLLR